MTMMGDTSASAVANAQKELPHDLLSEKSLIACLLIDSKSYDEIIELRLRSDDFYHPQYKIVFQGIQDLIMQSRPVDFVTLVSHLTDVKKIETLGENGYFGADFILNIKEDQASSANIFHYALSVKNKAILRELIRASNRISQRGMSFSGELKEFVSFAETEILGVSQDFGEKGPLTLLDAYMNSLADLENPNINDTGVQSGLKELDKRILGFQPGQMIIAAGRPGMGKTAFALTLGLNVSKSSGQAVVIFSLEMLAKELVYRILSNVMRIPSEKLRTKRFEQEDMAKLGAFASKIGEHPIFINDKSNLTIWDILSDCRRIKRECGIGMIIVDYVQLMRAHIKTPSREQQISEISRELKQMAKELECPVVALSQLNRGVESRTDKRPMVSDLRESGALEQDADMVILLYRDEVYSKDQCKEPGVAEIIIGKNRGGETGTAKVRWMGQFSSFENLAYEVQEQVH